MPVQIILHTVTYTIALDTGKARGP